MKIKEGFVLKTVAGETVALPSEGATNMDMMITLNGTACFLWEKLQTGAEMNDLTEALLNEYDVDEITAREAVENFVEKLKEYDFLA